MEKYFQAMEEKIKNSGYPGKLSGQEVYDDVCDQIDGKEDGSYVLLSKFSDDIVLEYTLTIMETEFNLISMIIRSKEGVFTVEFDK